MKLLVPSRNPGVETARSFNLDGDAWTIAEAEATAVAYVAISYACGAETTRHPLCESGNVSARALPVLARAARASNEAALWLDALCLPTEDADRTGALASLGAIYGGAYEVIVVLSQPCESVLAALRCRAKPNLKDLAPLAADAWVTRAWTYQELANAARVRFVAEGAGSAWADASELLDHVGHALNDLAKTESSDAFAVKVLHPRLDALQEVLAAWMLGGYLEHSAYSVMSAISGREALRPEDRLAAILGSIAAGDDDESSGLPPGERFMRACEHKGDFSFVYAAAPRDDTPGRSWRPRVDSAFEPVLAWHSWGAGQSGSLLDDGVSLEGMTIAELASPSPEALAWISEWLEDGGDGAGDDALRSRTLARLRAAGFSGCGDVLPTSAGYAFPWAPLREHATVLVAIATGVQMVHGAPCLLLAPAEGYVHACLGVGMFVGRLPERGAALRLR